MKRLLNPWAKVRELEEQVRMLDDAVRDGWKASAALREKVRELEAKLQLQGLSAAEWDAVAPVRTEAEVMEALKGVSPENGILRAVRGLLEAEQRACEEAARDRDVGEREERHISGGAWHVAAVLERLQRLHGQAQGDRRVVPVRRGRQRMAAR